MNQHGLARELLKGRLLTPAELAQRLGVSNRTVSRWIERKEIHIVKIGPTNNDTMNRDRRPVRVPEAEYYRLCDVTLRQT